MLATSIGAKGKNKLGNRHPRAIRGVVVPAGVNHRAANQCKPSAKQSLRGILGLQSKYHCSDIPKNYRSIYLQWTKVWENNLQAGCLKPAVGKSLGKKPIGW